MKKNEHILTPAGNQTPGGDFLTIEEIDSSPRLARMLPFQIAKRYQAIPIASDVRRMTIAMGDPTDAAARKAIQSALSSQVTLVRADPHKIAVLIARYYPSLGSESLRVIAWYKKGAIMEKEEEYIASFSKALNANLIMMEPEEVISKSLARLSEEIQSQAADLLIHPAFVRAPGRLRPGIPAEKKLLQHLSLSLLSLKGPRWPIQQILLILQNDRSDDWAVDWAVRLAVAFQARLTVLPVIPPAPPVYAGMQRGFPDLLDSNCQLGKRLRAIAHRLDSWEITGTFKLRDEPAEWQIRSEVEEGDFDLVITGANYSMPANHFMIPNLLFPLLGWITIPVLLAQNYPQGT